MNVACPKCGFDLEAGRPCRVCGYAPATLSSAPAGARAPSSPLAAPRGPGAPRPPAAKPAVPRRSAQGPVLVLVSASVGLLAVVGVFILGDLRTPDAAAPALGPALTSPPPKPPDSQPAPLAAAPGPAAPSPAAASGSERAPAPPVAAAPAPAASGARRARVAPVVAAPAPERSPLNASESSQPFDITARTEDPPIRDRASYVSWMLAHSDEKQKFLEQKWALAQSMIRLKSVTHRRVLEALLRAPREFFCRDARRAYEDAVLPIGYGQTISGPHMVARMTDYLDPQPDQRVLEIGTGSGYQSAVLAELSLHVYTIEIVEPLARETDAIYRAREAHYPEYRNIHRRVADGYYGWPEEAPFDRIIVTCGIDHVPPELLRELAPEGIMVIPVGPPSGQTILRIVKHVAADGSVTLDREDIFHGKKRQIFVPFRSSEGGVHAQKDQKDTR